MRESGRWKKNTWEPLQQELTFHSEVSQATLKPEFLLSDGSNIFHTERRKKKSVLSRLVVPFEQVCLPPDSTCWEDTRLPAIRTDTFVRSAEVNHRALAPSPTLTVALWIFKYWAAWNSHSREVLPCTTSCTTTRRSSARWGVLAQLPLDARLAGVCFSEETRGAQRCLEASLSRPLLRVS